MPSLFRFLIVLVILGILGGAAMIYLALFVGPHTREMTVRIPTEKLQARTAAAGAAGRRAAGSRRRRRAIAVARPARAAAGGHHIEAFLEMMSAERGAAPNTLASYRRDLEDYGRFLGARGSGFERAGVEAVRAYLDDLDLRGFAATSAARRLSALRQFHRFLVSEGVRGDDPTGIIEGPRRPARLPSVLSEARGHASDRAGARGGGRARAARRRSLQGAAPACPGRDALCDGPAGLRAGLAQGCGHAPRPAHVHRARQGRPRAHRAADRQGARGGGGLSQRRGRPPGSPTAPGCSPPSATAAT